MAEKYLNILYDPSMKIQEIQLAVVNQFIDSYKDVGFNFK